MNVVRHDHPCADLVALAVIKSEGTIHERGNLGPPQVTLALASVQVGFESLPALAVVFDFQESGPFGAERGGETVRQVKRDELREAWLIAMWHVAALMPAAEAESRVFTVGWRGIPALVRDQFAHAWVKGRS